MVDLLANAYDDALRKHARGALADLGCGNVPLYDTYKDLVSEVICVDWQNTPHGNLHVDIQTDLNEPLPLPDRYFDTVLATDVLEHLRRPAVFWGEAARILRPGGKLILGAPFLYWLHEEPHDYCRYTRHQLAANCRQHRLSVVSLAEYGGPLAVVMDVIGKTIPGARAARYFQAAASRIMRTRLAEQFDRSRAHRLPLGYCLVAAKL